MSKLNALSALLLRSPLLWGGAGAFCFFALIHGGVVTDATVVRYLAGHWVEYVEVAMFCVGLAALGLKALDLRRHFAALERPLLEPIPEGGQLPGEAVALAAGLPDDAASEGLTRRLRDALDFVARKGDAEALEDHLKYLADLDAARAAQGYGLVRFVIWAIPIMGFLGTVIGITVAIASLSPTQLENISGVVAGLGTAFDTTATALGLSMVLMFIQFVVDRSEQTLLGRIDEAAWRSLAGRFQSLAGDGGAAALAVARLGETLSRGSDRLLDAQEQAWRALERTASEGIRRVLDEAGERLQSALGDGLSRWGESFARAHDGLAADRDRKWIDAAESLGAAVQGLQQHQRSLADQTAMLGNVVDAARDITLLERSLDANLAKLASTGRFEETLATLAAAVQLLAARAGDVAHDARRVELQAARSGKAA